jgi:hypothetical protein
MAKQAKSKATRHTHGHSHESGTVVFHGVAQTLLNSTRLLTTLRTVKTGKQAREWLGLTQKELGEAIARTEECRRDFPFSDKYISALEAGRKPWLPDLRSAMARLMTDRIYKLTGETIGVSIRINSPWHVRLFRLCDMHGRYELKRANQKRCPKCDK